MHKTARDLFEDRRLRPLPLVSRTDTDSQNEEEKEKKDVEEKVFTEDVDLDGSPLKRHPSLPNIPLAVTASSSLYLVSTGFVEAYKIHRADEIFYSCTTYMTFYVFEFFWYFLKKKEKKMRIMIQTRCHVLCIYLVNRTSAPNIKLFSVQFASPAYYKAYEEAIGKYRGILMTNSKFEHNQLAPKLPSVTGSAQPPKRGKSP